MPTRRSLILALGAGLLGAPTVGRGQSVSGKVRRIGFLGSETAAGWASQMEAFRTGLRELGYVEGKTILIEYRWAGGAHERLPQLAVELLGEKVEVLVTHGTAGVRAAHRATTGVPIVICSLGDDPVSMGVARSLARPGGNITGSVSLSGTLATKQLELIKEALPRARKVAVMTSTAAPGAGAKERDESARRLKLDLHTVKASSLTDLEAAMAGMAERNIDALIVLNQTFQIAHFDRIAALAARYRIPALGAAAFPDSGGLLGYGANTLSNYRRAAYFIDRILKGARPAELPIEQPITFELVINMKTARTLGIRIPETVLARADRLVD